MSNKQIWSIVVGLILLNIATVLYFLLGHSDESDPNETIAQIGKEKITRSAWMEEMEGSYGKDTLKGMINEEVIKQMADRYDLTVSNQELENEWKLQQSLYGSSGQVSSFMSDGKLKRQLKSSILLEKLLTREVNIPDKEIKSYYDENKRLYDIPDSYNISHIVVKSKSEAETILKELKGGSSFDALAMEKSLDDFTSNKGGELGYLTLNDEAMPKEYSNLLKHMKKGEWKGPVKLDEGYGVLLLNEKIKGSRLSYKEIKPTLKRQMAMEQMNTSASPEIFWNEVGVDWFYGK